MTSHELSLADLQERIQKDSFLRDANFDPHTIANSLVYHKNDVAKTIKTLTNCAKWHQEILGHQSKRISIVHIHAFLLTEIVTFLPNAKGPDGTPILLLRTSKEQREIPKQHYANFNMWTHFRISRNDDGNHVHNLFVDLQGFNIKQFRPSQYKRTEEAVACNPYRSNDATLYVFNASKVTTRLWNTLLRIVKSASYPKVHFLKPEELSSFMDVSLIPSDFGGHRSLEDTRADMEAFIRSEYEREGLRYEPIDVTAIDWKTYKVPDVDLTVRPESAMSVASNIDFDEIDAQVEKLGLNNDPEE
ncbi:hypothetical protein BDR26DRAFT_1006182 [Obelidium mucronatum]|nr:hypothetical protein BDR26DRAFT_1006182 [Obelidium mucronatum]